MTTRIIPGAVSATSLRALVLTDQKVPPPVLLTDARGAKLPGLTLEPHASGDPRFDQHITGAGVYLYVAKAAGLKPATDYLVGGAHMKTFPTKIPRQGVNLALASCYSNLFKRDADYLKVLQGAAGYTPIAAKLLVGDNLYLDVGPHVGRSGFEEVADRYLQHFWSSDYAEVLGYLPTFTLWDDHEFWNNYPERQGWLMRINAARGDYGTASLLGVKTFQSVLNPQPAARVGLSYSFAIPPLSLFALDLRAGRTLHDAVIQRMCSEAELQAFERWASKLTGPGALVIGQPLWIHTGDHFDWNPPGFAAQYARIWKALASAPWDIVILSGDVHHSHLLEIDPGTAGRVWQLVSSPVCHIPSIESIMAKAFDVQARGGVNFPENIDIDVAAAGSRPRLAAYHMGSGCANTLALLNIKGNEDGSVTFAGKFVDLATKVAASWDPPPSHAPIAPGDHKWCQREPMFTLRRRPA